MDIMENIRKPKKNRKTWTLILLFASFLFGVCVFYLCWQYFERLRAEQFYEDMKEDYVYMPTTQINTQIPDGDGIAEPWRNNLLTIDFKALKKTNSDIYAWLDIPGTNVSYPVLQHSKNDSYYLEHTVNHVKGLPGSLYSESITPAGVIEPIHIIYGHNMKNKTMFGELHSYENEGYLEEHSYVYLYTPNCTYVYRIFASAVIDDIHLMYQHNFYTEDGREQYLEELEDLEKKSGKNHCLEHTVTTENGEFLILSTCMSTNKETRYTIHGVLLDKITN